MEIPNIPNPKENEISLLIFSGKYFFKNNIKPIIPNDKQSEAPIYMYILLLKMKIPNNIRPRNAKRRLKTAY